MNEIHQILVLSTAHITQASAEALESNDLPFSAWCSEYGFVISTGYPDLANLAPDKIPDDLKAVRTYARERGAAYLMLDRDASTVDRLPTYDW